MIADDEVVPDDALVVEAVEVVVLVAVVVVPAPPCPFAPPPPVVVAVVVGPDPLPDVHAAASASTPNAVILAVSILAMERNLPSEDTRARG